MVAEVSMFRFICITFDSQRLPIARSSGPLFLVGLATTMTTTTTTSSSVNNVKIERLRRRPKLQPTPPKTPPLLRQHRPKLKQQERRRYKTGSKLFRRLKPLKLLHSHPSSKVLDVSSNSLFSYAFPFEFTCS